MITFDYFHFKFALNFENMFIFFITKFLDVKKM